MNTTTRRSFIGKVTSTALGIGAFGELPIPTRAADAGMLNFGFSLYGMRSLATPDALRVCAEIGYDSVELAVMRGWPNDPQSLPATQRRDIRSLLQDLDLKLAGLMENVHAVAGDTTHRDNLDRLRAAAQLGHDVNPAKSGSDVVLETILGGKPAQWDELKGTIARRLDDWARVAEAENMTVAIKPHVGGALHTPEGAQWLRRQVNSPHVRLAYDYSHFALRRFDMRETIATMLPDTVFIHVKDSEGDENNVRFLLPGDGRIDYVTYFRLLNDAGYAGPVVVEVSGQIHGRSGYDPVAAAQRSYVNLAAAFRASGVRD